MKLFDHVYVWLSSFAVAALGMLGISARFDPEPAVRQSMAYTLLLCVVMASAGQLAGFLAARYLRRRRWPYRNWRDVKSTASIADFAKVRDEMSKYSTSFGDEPPRSHPSDDFDPNTN